MVYISAPNMDPAPELEQLIIQQTALAEQMKNTADDLELHIRFTYLDQQIRNLENGLSLSAFLFSRERT